MSFKHIKRKLYSRIIGTAETPMLITSHIEEASNIETQKRKGNI